MDESNTIADESIAIIFESIATACLSHVQGLYVRSSHEWMRVIRLVYNMLREQSGEIAEIFIFRFYLYARNSIRTRLYAGRRTRAGGGYFYFWFRCLIASYNHSIHAILFTAGYPSRDPELFTVPHFTGFRGILELGGRKIALIISEKYRIRPFQKPTSAAHPQCSCMVPRLVNSKDLKLRKTRNGSLKVHLTDYQY